MPNRALAVVQYCLFVTKPKPALLVKDQVTGQPPTHKRPSPSFGEVGFQGDGPHGTLVVEGVGFWGVEGMNDDLP